MDTVRLGRTNLIVTKNGFGALPVQRVDKEQAVKLLRRAYEGGINYFDTAHIYSDSEEKLGLALHDVRDKIIISTKAMTTTVEGFWGHVIIFADIFPVCTGFSFLMVLQFNVTVDVIFF